MKRKSIVVNSRLIGNILKTGALLPLILQLWFSCSIGPGSQSTGSDGSNQQNSTTSNTTSGIIFQQNFDNAAPGLTTTAQVQQLWANASPNTPCVDDGRVSVASENSAHKNTLRIFYPQGYFESELSGAQWKMQLPAAYNELYCSYDLKFQDGFQFAKGGKLPGFAGGTANSGGNVANGYDGWSARMMWRTNATMAFYVYHIGQAGTFGDLLWWENNGTKKTFNPGQWYHLAQRVVMNTVGKSDGILEGWMDGTKVYSITNMVFRLTNSLKIDIFYFSTFFGGNTQDWSSIQNQYAYFDNFVISTKPIN